MVVFLTPSALGRFDGLHPPPLTADRFQVPIPKSHWLSALTHDPKDLCDLWNEYYPGFLGLSRKKFIDPDISLFFLKIRHHK